MLKAPLAGLAFLHGTDVEIPIIVETVRQLSLFKSLTQVPDRIFDEAMDAGATVE